MSTLDRAFIKAFSDTGPRITLRTAHGPAGADPPHAGPSAPVGRSSAAPASRSSQRHVAEAFRVVDSHTSRAPLSTFSGAVAIEPFRPATEVDRLTWPPVCDKLLAQASVALNGFADYLVERTDLGHKCIAVASRQRRQGRTTVCMVIARHLAARGLRPIVVDADFGNPAIATACGLPDSRGWIDVLLGELPLGEALVAAHGDGVALMPLRHPAGATARLAGAPRVVSGFGMLRSQYDLTILDTPPLDCVATISEWAGLGTSIRLDALYLLDDLRPGSSDQLLATWRGLRDAGMHVEGIIENFVTPEVANSIGGANPQSPAGRQL